MYGYGMTETRIKNEIKRDTRWAIIFGAIAIVAFVLAAVLFIFNTPGTDPLPIFAASVFAAAKTFFTVSGIRDNKELLRY